MSRRFLLSALALLALPGIAVAQTAEAPPAAEPAPVAPPPVEAPPPTYATVRVTLQTTAGPIVLELEKERAPVTTANFLRYVDQKRLDGTTFYRSMRVTPDFGVIQGGAQNDPKRILAPVAHEPTTKTGLTHLNGTVSMARYTPGSATADFFIMVGPAPSFDADPSKPGDNLGYAAFGQVVEGLDVVKAIFDAPLSATKGEGVMRGQMIDAPIRIITARRQQ